MSTSALASTGEWRRSVVHDLDLVTPYDVALRIETLRIASEVLMELGIHSMTTEPVVTLADWLMQDHG